MKLTTTETKQYAMLVVKLSTGASVSLAEYNKFRALVVKMKKPEGCRGKCKCKAASKCALAVTITAPIAPVLPADLEFTTC